MNEFIEKLQLKDSEKSHITAVYQNACRISEQSPRLRYFTLHGGVHIRNLFKLMEILRHHGGLSMTSEEEYMLSMAICLHDVGMYARFGQRGIEGMMLSGVERSDVAKFETYIRRNHHELISEYIENHFSFLSALGIAPTAIMRIRNISRGHRVVSLSNYERSDRRIAAVLRLIDELDVGPSRAPVESLLENIDEMDSISCWHWYKHNIVEEWEIGRNVKIVNDSRLMSVAFDLAVFPATGGSIDYWLEQIRRPISSVLETENVSRIIQEEYGVRVSLNINRSRSAENTISPEWVKIEEMALFGNSKIILLADDEYRKIEDVLYLVAKEYFVVFAVSAREAIEKINAMHVEVAIVDMQMGSGRLWSSEETNGYKSTGMLLVQEIRNISPKTKIIVLTATRHVLDHDRLSEYGAILLRKPVSPEKLYEVVSEAVSFDY